MLREKISSCFSSGMQPMMRVMRNKSRGDILATMLIIIFSTCEKYNWPPHENYCFFEFDLLYTAEPRTAETRLQFPWASRTISIATCHHKETPTSCSTSSRILCPLIWPPHPSRLQTVLYSQNQYPPRSLYPFLKKSLACLLLPQHRHRGSRGRITRSPLCYAYLSLIRTCLDLHPQSH